MSRHTRDKAGPPALRAAREALHQGEIEWPPRRIVLVDIDGTLSNPEHRLWRVKGPGRKDWSGFFADCAQDPPVEPVVRWVRALSQCFTVVLVSGRPINRTGAKTVRWLAHYRVPYFRLFMRKGGDHRPDTQVKQEILDDILRILPSERVAFAIDDRLSVIEEVGRRNQIRVFPVRATDADFY